MQVKQRSPTLRTRWLMWRARLSVPSLLASNDEQGVVSALAATNGALAILLISVMAWLTDLPLIFPALGPSAFIMFSSPFSPPAAPRSVILGHLVGMSTGFIVWHAASFIYDEPVSIEAGGLPVCCSATLALAITSLLLVRLKCPHAPSAASALVVALGGVVDGRGLLVMALGVVILSAQAFVVHRLAGVNAPVWRPRNDEPL